MKKIIIMIKMMMIPMTQMTKTSIKGRTKN